MSGAGGVWFGIWLRRTVGTEYALLIVGTGLVLSVAWALFDHWRRWRR